MLDGVLLFINPNLKKKINQTEAFSHPGKVRVKRREKAMVIKQEPEGKEEAVLCPCYARLRGGGKGNGGI